MDTIDDFDRFQILAAAILHAMEFQQDQDIVERPCSEPFHGRPNPVAIIRAALCETERILLDIPTLSRSLVQKAMMGWFSALHSVSSGCQRSNLLETIDCVVLLKDSTFCDRLLVGHVNKAPEELKRHFFFLALLSRDGQHISSRLMEIWSGEEIDSPMNDEEVTARKRVVFQK